MELTRAGDTDPQRRGYNRRVRAAGPIDPNATSTFVRRASLDILQRSPSPAEMNAWCGAPLAAVVGGMRGRLEAMETWLEEQLFYFLLIDNFRPRTPAFEALPAALHARRISAKDAIAETLLSTSFSLRNPGNDTFVTVVLEQCLGAEVQDKRWQPVLEAGKKLYDGQRGKLLGQSGDSQADVVRIVLAQEAFSRHLLDRHHRQLLGTPLPARGAATDAVARVHATPARFFDVLDEWMTSAAYLEALSRKKLRSDRQFIRSLYMDLLERTPTYEELRNMRNALQSMADSTPLRAVMAKVILDSGKARLPVLDRDGEAGFVRQCFERYLGRAPAQTESARFVAALRSEGATPALIVRTLVSSPEYQTY